MPVRRFPQVIHTWMYGAADFESIAQSIAETGADGIDLGMTLNGPANSPQSLLKIDMQGILARHGLKTLAATPLFNCPEVDLSSPDPKTMRTAREYASRSLDAVRHAGGDRMMIAPSWFSVNHKLNTTYEDDFARAAESAACIAEEASRRGVLLLIEPINRFRAGLVHSLDDAFRMIRMAGHHNLGIAADTFHLNIEEEQGVAGSIVKAGAMLRCLHIGENNRKPPGYGCLDWKSILLALRAIDFDGPLSYEPVYYGFDETRVHADPAVRGEFQKMLSHGIGFLHMIMDSLS